MIFVGIDPGLDGAIAVILPDGKLHFEDTPTLMVTGGRKQKREYNIQAMANLLNPLQQRYASVTADPTGQVMVGLESVHAMPIGWKDADGRERGQGVTSMFSMGHGFGLWKGILAAFQIPYELVPPQRWKKHLMNGQGHDKDASRGVAMRLYPQSAQHLTRKKDHGRADALLIAEYVRRENVKADEDGFSTNKICQCEHFMDCHPAPEFACFVKGCPCEYFSPTKVATDAGSVFA